jgi:hypothetical protein
MSRDKPQCRLWSRSGLGDRDARARRSLRRLTPTGQDSGVCQRDVPATDVAPRQTIVHESLATGPGIAASVLRASGEFHEAAVLGSAAAPTLSIGSAGPANPAAVSLGLSGDRDLPDGRGRQFEVRYYINAMIERFLAIAMLEVSR